MAKALTAAQLVARYHDSDDLRLFLEQHSEAITLCGPFAKRERQRHAPSARFKAFRQRMRATELSRTYAHCMLLGGLS
jgi:hypothetical protein